MLNAKICCQRTKLTVISIYCIYGCLSAGIVGKATFENGIKNVKVETNGGTVSSVKDPTGGKQGNVAKCVITSGERAEVRYDYRAPLGKERWYGVKLMIPDGGKGGIITQWHRWQSCMANNTCKWAKGNPMALNGGTSGNYVLKYSYGGANNRKNESIEMDRKCSIDAGKWVQWVLHAKWSKGSDGFLVLYCNGSKLLDIKGANWLDLPIGPYFKAGIYTGDPRGARTVYVDDFVEGDANSSYEEMALAQATSIDLSGAPNRDKHTNVANLLDLPASSIVVAGRHSLVLSMANGRAIFKSQKPSKLQYNLKTETPGKGVCFLHVKQGESEFSRMFLR